MRSAGFQIPGGQILRFIANGLFAAGVHFFVLYLLMVNMAFASAGIAGLLAAVVGTAVSYLGCRWLVFGVTSRPILLQAARFWSLYAVMAALHGMVLWLWSDIGGLDFRLGFVLATALQSMLTFIGARQWVFQR